ncbi:MAG: cell division protein FtsQ, partial [Bacteroidaceae bacterium]|nr:cell division protein FtsQ [Bacteroidaceae bacterium]
MTFNWKKIAIITTDVILAVYLLLAVTAFNRPDEQGNVCSGVSINIQDGLSKGFLNANEIKSQLQRAKLYPLGYFMVQVDTRRIEEALLQNPLVEKAQCYKTQTGRVNIELVQRMPIIRVKANNGDDYYIDEHSNIMPNVHYVSNLVVATGYITKQYAQKTLSQIGNYLIHHP